MKNHGAYLFWVVITGSLLPANSHGFDIGAHRELSLRAVDPDVENAARLHSYLFNTLFMEFGDGIYAQFPGGTSKARNLIAQGSVQEDSPAIRVTNHFHDPTRNWAQAGERLPPGLLVGNSSVVWSQLSPQGAIFGGSFSWKDARDAFYKALTSTTISQRNNWYTKTFETLGHLIHLVQDAAVPAHTRNDNHLQPFKWSMLPDGDWFHRWADSTAGTGLIKASPSARFDPSILNQASPNSNAPVPIARIIDKTDGDYGILSPGFNIGLAEYSNANFISQGTGNLASSGYQYPRMDQLEFYYDVGPGPFGFVKPYARFRVGFGEQDYAVGVSTRTYGFVRETVPLERFPLGLDDKVHADYGRKLFPRAIGYSAGLIDYFFRGKATSDYILGVQVPYAQRPNTLTVPNITISSGTGNEQAGTGTVQLVLLLDRDSTDETGEVWPPIITSQPAPIAAGSGPQTVTFSFNGPLPFPAVLAPYSTATGYGHSLIYRGPLGQESDAVVAGAPCPLGQNIGGLVYFMRALKSIQGEYVDVAIVGTLSCGA